MAEIEVRSPYDGAVVGRVKQATREDAERAVEQAVEAFEHTRRIAAYERRDVLAKISESIAEQRDEFVRLMALEAGKPAAAARAEVERAVFTFRVASEEALRMRGEVLPLDWQAQTKGSWSIIRRYPVGAILGITPFNFPLNLVAHKVAPAIAVGCPIIIKPAPQTPLTAFRLADLAYAAGWPRAAMPVLPLGNEDAEALVRDDRIKMLSFTGSSKVGWELKAKCGKKKITLELGGNAAVIVHADADVDHAIARCMAGSFTYAGQSCISVQRIFVHETLYERFSDELAGRARALRTGDPLDAKTEVGPMIRASDVERVEEWIAEAVASGAREIAGDGGGRRTAAAASVLKPAVLVATKPEMRVNSEEIFAPVCSVMSYSDFSEAITQVNDSRYGLQAGVFTHDARLIFQAFDELEVGGVVINDVPTFRIDHMPYGGVKDSGFGREGVRYAMEDMTEPRILIFRG